MVFQRYVISGCIDFKLGTGFHRNKNNSHHWYQALHDVIYTKRNPKLARIPEPRKTTRNQPENILILEHLYFRQQTLTSKSFGSALSQIKKSKVKVMSHVLTKRYLYGFNGIGTRFCSSFKSVSIVSRTHCVDFDICSDIDRFYKANSYSTYYSLNLCQLKCTWSQSKPLKHHNIGPISDENLSF